jgi:hypothetical protein
MLMLTTALKLGGQREKAVQVELWGPLHSILVCIWPSSCKTFLLCILRWPADIPFTGLRLMLDSSYSPSYSPILHFLSQDFRFYL